MAHQIFQDRRMFYSGATPWHGLGTALPANATWEQVQALAMFAPVHERPLVIAGGMVAPDVKALISSDDGRYLATVGADYCVVQAETIARAIMEAAMSEGAIFHTGGVLGATGARGWLMGELPAASFMVGGDNSPVRAYFTGVWGHDGRTAVKLANNATRAVCANTVAAALGERGNFKVTIKHTSGANDAIAGAVRSFHALAQSMGALRDFAEKAAQTRITRQTVADALEALFPAEEEESERQREAREAAQVKVLDLLGGPTVSPDTRATAWGLMQAASEFSEHFAARITDAQKQIDAIATRQIDAAANLAPIYATIARVAGMSATI